MRCCFFLALVLVFIPGAALGLSIRHGYPFLRPPRVLSLIELPHPPPRQKPIFHEQSSAFEYYHEHEALLYHISKGKGKLSWQDYRDHEALIKKKRIAKSLLKTALMLSAGVAAKKLHVSLLAYLLASTTTTTTTTTECSATTFGTSPTTFGTSPTTSTTESASTKSTTESTSTSTTTPTTTTSSTTTPTTSTSSTSTATTPTTTTSSTSTTTTRTTTTSATTTTPTTPTGCNVLDVIYATSVGQMGNIEFSQKVTGNTKLCSTIVAPSGGRVQIVCSVVNLIQGGTSANHSLQIKEGNAIQTVIANPPMQNTTYTSTGSSVIVEANVTSSDTFS